MDESLGRSSRRYSDVGGTPGGLGMFFLGFAMAAGGGYLLLNQVTVTSHFWHIWGYNAFGLSLVPLLIGVALLFYNGRSIAGWLLVVAGAAIIFAGIIVNLQIFFRATSLFNTMLILVLFVGGLGLVARALR